MIRCQNHQFSNGHINQHARRCRWTNYDAAAGVASSVAAGLGTTGSEHGFSIRPGYDAPRFDGSETALGCDCGVDAQCLSLSVSFPSDDAAPVRNACSHACHLHRSEWPHACCRGHAQCNCMFHQAATPAVAEDAPVWEEGARVKARGRSP